MDQKSFTAAKATLNDNLEVHCIAHLQGLFKTFFSRLEAAPFFAARVSGLVSFPGSSWKAVSWLTSRLASWGCFWGPSLSSDSDSSDTLVEYESDSLWGLLLDLDRDSVEVVGASNRCMASGDSWTMIFLFVTILRKYTLSSWLEFTTYLSKKDENIKLFLILNHSTTM